MDTGQQIVDLGYQMKLLAQMIIENLKNTEEKDKIKYQVLL
jgi:hypothetical protein